MVGIDPGCVRLRLGSENGRVSQVSVNSERPAMAERLRGRSADEAVPLVPLLFGLCGKAQGRAAMLALEAARGRPCGSLSAPHKYSPASYSAPGAPASALAPRF